MKNLHFRETFKKFLYDLDHFITIYDDFLHVFIYEKLDKLTSTEIIILINNYRLKITGENLKINKMTKQELLIKGSILKVEFIYE